MTRKVGTFGDLRSAIHSGEIFYPTADLFQDVAASEYLFAYLRREAPRWTYGANTPPLEPLVVCGGMRIGNLSKHAAWGLFRKFFEAYFEKRGVPFRLHPVSDREMEGVLEITRRLPPARLPAELLAILLSCSTPWAENAQGFQNWWAAHGRDRYEDAWLAWLEKHTPAASAQPRDLLERSKR